MEPMIHKGTQKAIHNLEKITSNKLDGVFLPLKVKILLGKKTKHQTIFMKFFFMKPFLLMF